MKNEPTGKTILRSHCRSINNGHVQKNGVEREDIEIFSSYYRIGNSIISFNSCITCHCKYINHSKKELIK